MTMVSSGPISIGGSATTGGLNQSINIELGRSATTSSNLNESALRTLAGVPSGTISLSNFYGKSNQFSFTLTGTNVNLRDAAVAAGWNQSSRVVATIAAPTTISSSSTGTPALTVNGSFPGGVELINNGVIVGRGGNGGNGGSSTTLTGAAGAGGGTALSVSSAISITNNGTVAGGGGGGGGGGAGFASRGNNGGGGGGGGGRGVSSGGAGGGGVPAPGTPGGAGTLAAAGTGGPGGNAAGQGIGGTGGPGGGYGSTGTAGNIAVAGNVARYGGGGAGAAGPATSGNANITWLVTGNRFGPLN